MKNQTRILFVAILGCLMTFIVNSCNSLEDDKASGLVRKSRLTAAEELRFKRFLHPMPQELRLSGAAYEIASKDCAMADNPTASTREKLMIADFKAKWLKNRGSALLEKNATLTIVAGIIKNSPELQKAAEERVFDDKYLSERRNAEQAYALATVSEADGITVYVAANATPGLYYGLLTFEQLLKGLSQDSNLLFPHCQIVDWPDVRWRGSWSVLTTKKCEFGDDNSLTSNEKRIKKFSEWKMNMIEGWTVKPKSLDENGNLAATWSYPKELVSIGKNYGVDVIPGTGHITFYRKTYASAKKYPDINGRGKTPESKNHSLCHSHPDTQKYLTEFLVAVAKEFDTAIVGMSEVEGPTGVCHCPQCKGDLRQYFIKETKALMAAYGEAKKANPKFRMILTLTQGSYPHNIAILEHLPKDVVLNFYHGLMTYRTTFQKHNLPPSIMEMKRLGYSVGSTPSPVPWHDNMFAPFQTPHYVRLLCGEAEDREMEFVNSFFWPNPFFWSVNGEAMAEFLWNGDGRSAEEFTIAWATRHGLKNPKETAAIIDMMEYPERGFYNCNFKNLLPGIVAFAAGKDRPNTSTLRGFEFKSHDEMARLLNICEEATRRAAKLENPELLAGCQVMRCCLRILESYTYCVRNAKNKDGKDKAIKIIKAQLKLYPELFNKWLATKKPSSYAKGYLDKYLKKILAPATELEKPQKTSLATEKLLEAQRAGKLKSLKLDSSWKFKPSSNDEGIKQKWFSSEFDEQKWSPIKVGKGYGWEKQGHEGYIGHAWYRRKLEIPPDTAKLKHLYLLFKGVDEDAEVFVNGKKVFTHDYKTVGGAPGSSTWEKPFSFDVKKVLKAGENTIAVRVYNRLGMGGIWQPVYLVATEQTAKTEDLVAVMANRKEDKR